jgi:hypothetical protein
MSVSTQHPDYIRMKDDWRLCRDAFKGETKVKSRGVTYLPKPSGFLAQGDNGEAAYNAYKLRAQFPEIMAPTVRGLVGTIHGADWEIELPETMQYLFERATPDGQTLEVFARRITAQILMSGRFGVLADIPIDGELPYLASYCAETIINWDEDSSLFVLDESDYFRDGFVWVYEDRWRVLEMEDGVYVQKLYKSGGQPGEEIQPSARGGQTLDEIPFVVIGSTDLTPEPEEPPLIGVARAALAYYRLDADYRHQLFNSGQETLFVINADPPEYVGAGVVHKLEGAEGIEVDAKYVGPSGRTIEAHKAARMDELGRAADAGARLFAEDGGANESGDARRLRYSSETANLKTIAQSSAAGLERALRYCARLIGANEAEVMVRAPTKMLEPVMTGREALELVQAWQAGGFSFTTLHENLKRGQLIPMDREAEDELRLMDVADFSAEGDLDAP